MKNEKSDEYTALIELNKRLGVVISLLLRGLPAVKGKIALREQVELLEELGMRPKEIADILGRSSSYVSKELVAIRKNKNG